ncbi:unnamed protein product [Mytilus edulis]|uniref:Secreted protein n=1 Tax=Mytilus edulis TaxID=6550 RepID=A0A8S3R7M9_MYTED|nr:unnamed protein product [Mytilus edulis]
MKILFVCFVFGIGIAGVLGRRCVVYSAGETIPSIPKGARYGRTCHSVLFDPKRYCIEWDCPQTDCSNPIIPYSGCPYCQGLGIAGVLGRRCVVYTASETIPTIPPWGLLAYQSYVKSKITRKPTQDKTIYYNLGLRIGIAGVISRRCVVYTPSETIPAIPKGARLGRTCHSVMTDQNNYCIEWECPPTDCSDPIIPETGCPHCKGNYKYVLKRETTLFYNIST